MAIGRYCDADLMAGPLPLMTVMLVIIIGHTSKMTVKIFVIDSLAFNYSNIYQ